MTEKQLAEFFVEQRILQPAQAEDVLSEVEFIAILGGLVLSTVGYARKKGARARAETEIAAMGAACEPCVKMACARCSQVSLLPTKSSPSPLET